MAAHAILSASSASRWLNCTPSVKATEKIPEGESSVFAQEGTLAHSLGELMLNKELKLITTKEYNKELKKIQANELYDNDMPEEVEKYTSHVIEKYSEALATTKDALIFLEQRLDFSEYVPEGFGTGDCLIIADGTLEIIDLKYGKGVEVSAQDNPQMKLYALGALCEYGFIYDIEKVRMTIAQPRLNNFDTYELTVDDLMQWAEGELKTKAEMAFNGEGEYNPGSWCKWCKIKNTCRKRAELYAQIEQKDPNILTNDEIAEFLIIADDLQSWAKGLQDYALEKALEGEKFPGWKVVEGRSNRKYIDDDEVAIKLIEDGLTEDIIYNKKLKGITDMEKTIGKKKFNELLSDLVIKPEGKPALVVESDKRPELNSAETDFDL